MEFRIAVQGDTESIRAGKKYAYNFPDEYLDRYMRKVFSAGKCVVCTEDGGIVSYAQSADYQINVSGRICASRYIGDVYTMPSKRRMGYMKGSIKNLLRIMNSELIPFAFCVPFDYKIFDSLGFRLVSDIKEYNITADDIPAYRMSCGVNLVCSMDMVLAGKINSVYDAYMNRTDRSYTIRTDAYWQDMVQDFIESYGGNLAVFYDPEKNIQGYMMYTAEKGVLQVYEYAYKTAAAYKSLLAFLKNHKYQAERIIIKSAADDSAYLDFAGNNTLTKLMPFAMARITNVSEVLKSICADLSGINLKVFDPMLEANSGVWSIGSTGVMPSSDAYDFETDAGTLTQLYLGYISAGEAMYMGYMKNVSGNNDKERLIRNTFRKRDNYINMLL